MFGLDDVGAAQQALRGETGGEVLKGDLCAQLHGEKLCRQGGTDQQCQQVLVLCHQSGRLNALYPRAVDQGLRLIEIEGRDDAGVEALLDQPERSLPAFQGLAGEGQRFIVSRQGQITLGNCGNQADPGSAARFFGSEILFQRFLLEALHPAEEVEFVSADAESGAVLPADFRRTGAGKIGRQPLDAAGGAGVELGEEPGALDLVKGAVFLDIEGGDLEVAVVGQGEFDHFLQTGFDEKFPPGNLGHYFVGRRAGFRLVSRPTRPAGRDRCLRSFIARRQGTGRASKQDHAKRRTTETFTVFSCTNSWSVHVTIPPQYWQQVLLRAACIFSGQRAATPGQRRKE